MQMGQDIPEESDDPKNLELLKEAVDELEKSDAKKEGAKKESTMGAAEKQVAEVDEKDTEARLEEIKAYREVLGKDGVEPSPMLFLRRKELELKGELLEAEKKAEIHIADARRKAARIRADADEMAVAESKKYFMQEIGKAEEAAEEIKNSVQEEIKKAIATGQKNIDKGVKLVLGVVTLTE